MATIGTIRRKNFRRLVAEVWGGLRPLVAEALGFAQPQLVTRYMSEGKIKKIGDELARKIEATARSAGADWVDEGWLDTPHEDEGPHRVPKPRGGSFDERIGALPEPLRQYLVMELDICETVQDASPTRFMRAPTFADRRAFQDYLHDAFGRLTTRRTA